MLKLPLCLFQLGSTCSSLMSVLHIILLLSNGNKLTLYVCGLCMYIVQGYKKKDSYIACQGML